MEFKVSHFASIVEDFNRKTYCSSGIFARLNLVGSCCACEMIDRGYSDGTIPIVVSFRDSCAIFQTVLFVKAGKYVYIPMDNYVIKSWVPTDEFVKYIRERFMSLGIRESMLPAFVEFVKVLF